MIASADTVQKAAQLAVTPINGNSYHVESRSRGPEHPHTVYRAGHGGFRCTCPAGSDNATCSHRLAVEMYQHPVTRSYDPETLTEEELNVMSLGELARMRNAATIRNREIAEARSLAIKNHAVLTNDMDRYKRTGMLEKYYATREQWTISKATVEHLAIRQSAMKMLCTTLQNAIRNAQAMGG